MLGGAVGGDVERDSKAVRALARLFGNRVALAAPPADPAAAAFKEAMERDAGM
jgi:hypothetical protein